MNHKWKILNQKEIFKTSFYRLRSDECELPDGRRVPHYYVMEFADWANVIPVTKSGEIILIEQYRHALGKMTWEFPGGSLSHHNPEDPAQAAARELREETGYEAASLHLVGKHCPNPALQNNLMHTYVALGCELKGSQDLDPFEDITVTTKPIQDVERMVLEGAIEHSLMIASFYLALRYLQKSGFVL